MENLKKLFEPESIAVVGASETEGKVGNMIARNLLDLGYGGELFFINPKHDTLFGKTCYKALENVPRDVDCAVIVTPGKFVNDVVKNGAVKCKNYVVISAGFGEVGLQGHKREMALQKITSDLNLTILGPNCLGFLTPALSLNASFASGMPDAGSVALVSQSGALAVAFLDKAVEEGIGFSKVISVGNKMQLGAEMLLEYLADDPQTKVIALYLEGINDGPAFASVASRVAQKKPIIVLKAGRSGAAQKAMALHTGSLAGSDAVVSTALAKAGVVRASDMQEFFALIRLASKAPQLFLSKKTDAPLRIAIVTNAGGPGVLCTDAFEGAYTQVAQLDQETKDTLAKKLPEAASVQNPIDVLGDADDVRYKDALGAVVADKNVDVILTVLTPQDNTPVERVSDVLIAAAQHTHKPLLASFIGSKRVHKSVLRLVSSAIVHTRFPEIAVRALARIQQTIAHKEHERSAMKINSRRKKQNATIIKKAKTSKQPSLYFDQAARIAQAYGVSVSDFWDVTEKKDLSHVSYPCVAKIDHPSILHKSDKQGVILPIANISVLEKAVDQLLVSFPAGRVIAQPLAQIKQELIIGMKRDPVFGPVIIAGIGGIYTEIFKKTEIFLPPHTQQSVEEKLHEGSLGFLFAHTRGQKPYDIEGVAHTIIALMAIAHEQETITMIDINPLLVYNNGTNVVAVDVKMLLQ